MKRRERLEAIARQLRQPLELEQQRQAGWERALADLFDAFPEQRHEALAAFIESDGWKGSGLEHVLLLIRRGFWRPVPIPDPVAAVFLAEPAARPDAHCAGCGTVFPYQIGM